MKFQANKNEVPGKQKWSSFQANKNEVPDKQNIAISKQKRDSR